MRRVRKNLARVAGAAVVDMVAAAVVVVAAAAMVVDMVAVGEEVETEVVATNFLSQLVTALESRGLCYLGTVDLDVSLDFQRYQEWLASGFHASLAYLENNAKCRENVEEALPGAKRAILFALPYGPAESWPMPEVESPRVALYARFQDYHRLMKERAESALAESGISSSWRVCVDSVPLLERALANKSGTGFIGKNTCFIKSEWGSFLLLGEILTTEAFPVSQLVETASCGTCSLCQVECPTGALDKDYVIDSGKCLSYWTIEQRGPIPAEYWPWIGKYWFGCDICQNVCPYNKDSSRSLPESIPTRTYPSLFHVATMNQEQYQTYFGGTALTRAKRNGLRRNALIAMHVTGDSRLPEALALAALDDASPIRETIATIRALPNSPSFTEDTL